MNNSINNAKTKEKKKLIKDIQEAYESKGQAYAFDQVNAFNKNHILVIPFESCKACETYSPAIDHNCLICGQETKPSVIEYDIKITGSGSKLDIANALRTLAHSLEETNEVDLEDKTTEFEDKILITEIKPI